MCVTLLCYPGSPDPTYFKSPKLTGAIAPVTPVLTTKLLNVCNQWIACCLSALLLDLCNGIFIDKFANFEETFRLIVQHLLTCSSRAPDSLRSLVIAISPHRQFLYPLSFLRVLLGYVILSNLPEQGISVYDSSDNWFFSEQFLQDVQDKVHIKNALSVGYLY